MRTTGKGRVMKTHSRLACRDQCNAACMTLLLTALACWPGHAGAETRYDLALIFPAGGKVNNIYNQVNAHGDVVGFHANWKAVAGDSGSVMSYAPAILAGGKLSPMGQGFGGRDTVAYSINAAGHVAGCSETAAGVQHAYLYAAGRMQDLGTFKHERSCASMVNDHDDLVGNLSDGNGSANEGKAKAFLYRKGSMRELDDIIAPNHDLFHGLTYALFSASSINNNGDMLLHARASDGQIATVMFSGGRLTMPDPAFQMAHRALSAAFGHLTAKHEFVANEWDDGAKMGHAFIFRDGHYQAIGAPEPDTSVQVYDINTDGLVVGSASRHHGDGPHVGVAVTFTAGKMEDLNTLVDTDKLTMNGKRYQLSIATGINDNGVIVGDASVAGVPGSAAVFILAPRAPGEHLNAAAMEKVLQYKGAVEIYDILFDSGKASVTPASKPTLEQIAKLLKDDPALKLEVSGHTDNNGTPARNLVLSKSRAQAVVRELVLHYGIDSRRLQATGYGDSKPVAANDNATGRATNRRVELRKIEPK